MAAGRRRAGGLAWPHGEQAKKKADRKKARQKKEGDTIGAHHRDIKRRRAIAAKRARGPLALRLSIFMAKKKRIARNKQRMPRIFWR